MDTQQQYLDLTKVFDRHYLDARAHYLSCYGTVPSTMWVDQVDIEKALRYLQTEYAEQISGLFQRAKFDRRSKKAGPGTSIILLRDRLMVTLSGEDCDIFFNEEDRQTATGLLTDISRFRRKPKRKPFEIFLVMREHYGLDLRGMAIRKTKLNLSLYFDDEFLHVDRIIRERLNRKNDKGIVLLHGLPGTGKTTYLRYLIGRLRKRALFLSPQAASNLDDTELMDLLIDNPDSVLIIEDAENLIMDRRVSGNSSVSNLLNVSDGLLSDFLSLQVICTFNHPLSMVDPALLREGRLIARYEFGRLPVEKARRLSEHLGIAQEITEPLTLAEISNPNRERTRPANAYQPIGFRRNAVSVN